VFDFFPGGIGKFPAVCRSQTAFYFFLLDGGQCLGLPGGCQAVPEFLNEQNTFSGGKASDVWSNGHQSIIAQAEAIVKAVYVLG
jgi:hypothetical protein